MVIFHRYVTNNQMVGFSVIEIQMPFMPFGRLFESDPQPSNQICILEGAPSVRRSCRKKSHGRNPRNHRHAESGRARHGENQGDHKATVSQKTSETKNGFLVLALSKNGAWQLFVGKMIIKYNWTPGFYRWNWEFWTLDKSVASLPGLKLFEAQAGTAAEYDKAAAEKYKAEIDTRMKTLEDEAWMECGLELVGGLELFVFIVHFIKKGESSQLRQIKIQIETTNQGMSADQSHDIWRWFQLAMGLKHWRLQIIGSPRYHGETSSVCPSVTGQKIMI